jgi:hypothetical protein
MDRFNLKNLNDVEIIEEYQVKTSIKFAALGYMDDDMDRDNFTLPLCRLNYWGSSSWVST